MRLRHVGDLVPQLVHRDEPLVDQPEDQLGIAAPADGVPVGVPLEPEENALVTQALVDRLVDLEHVLAGEPVEAVDEDAELVQGRDHLQVPLLADLEVLCARSRGRVDYARALRLAHLVPQHDAVLDAPLRGQLVEGAAVAQPVQGRTGHLLDDLVLALHLRQPALEQVQHLALVRADLRVGKLGVNVRARVARQRPGRGRPHEERLTLAVDQRKLDVEAGVHDLLVTLGHDLLLGQAGAAPRAPGHHVRALVDPAALAAHLQEVPDRVVVLVGHREVRVVPVHPVAQPDRLPGLDVGVLSDAGLAQLHEPLDAELLDVALRFEAQLLLDLHLDPQPLAVEAVLVALAEPLHRLVALEQVLVGAAPGVVDAHGVVRGDRTVDEREPPVGVVVAAQVLLHYPRVVPPLEYLPLHGRKVHLRVDRSEHLSPPVPRL